MAAFINNEEGCGGNLTGHLTVKLHRAGGILPSHDDGGWHLNVPESGAAIGSLDLRAQLVFQPGLSVVLDHFLHRFDKSGIIRYKQIGPLTPQALDGTILPLVRKLQQS